MKRTLRVALSAAWLLPGVGHAAAAPKLVEACNACHGDQGVSSSQNVPTIAGISSGVHDDALKAFKSRSRPCNTVSYPRGAARRQGDMCSIAGKLSEADIAALADHYGRLPFVPMKQPFDAAKAAAGSAIHERDCKSCHSNGGRDPGDEAGLLGGQPIGYLKAALAGLRADQAGQPKKMKEKIAKLSDADIEALAHFYGSEQ